MRWTVGTLLALAEKYISRNILLPNDLLQIQRSYPKNEVLCKNKTLNILARLLEKFDNCSEIYGTCEELLEDLEIFGNFPMNAELLGLGSDCLNYLTTPKSYFDKNGNGFMPKIDVFLLIYGKLSVIENDGDELLNELLMSWGNRFSRKLKNFYRFVTLEEAEEICRIFVEMFTNEKDKSANFNKMDGFATIENLYSNISTLFDSSNDKPLLENLHKSLYSYKKSKPISKNREFYEKIHQKHYIIDKIMKKLMNQNIFEESFGSCVVRIFDDEGNMFMMVEEVENAFGRKVNEEIKEINGFLRTISFEKYEKLLKEFEIDENDICLISHKITRTGRNIGIPIITPKGTHCKLAIDAFSDIFEYFSTSLRLFETSTFNKSKLDEIYEWFREELDIYTDVTKLERRSEIKGDDEKGNGRFFVELWKIEEMIGKAKHSFGKGKILDEPKNSRQKKKNLYNKNETIEEVHNILKTNVIKIEDDVIQSRFLYYAKMYQTPYLMPRLIHRIYEYSVKIGFISGDKTCRDFVCRQGVCRQQLFRGFGCYCNMFMDSMFERMLACKKKYYTNEEINTLSGEHVEANYIKFLDIFKYCLVAENGEKYYDNDNCLLKTLDLSLVNLTSEDKEIARAIYQQEYSEMKRIFYLNKDETMQFVKDNTNNFNENIMKISTTSSVPSKNTIMKWENVWDELCDFFSSDDQFFEKTLKPSLKKHEKATKAGIPLDVFAQLKKKCRFFQFFYRKCAEHMSSLTEFTKISDQKKNRKCVLRMMSASRLEDSMIWHCFIDEFMEFAQVYSDVCKGTDSLIRLIESYHLKHFNADTFSTVGVDDLNRYSNFTSLKNLNLIVLVPDIQLMKCFIELPLKMGYDCVKIQAPNREWVYHNIQAEFLVFQNTACDIDVHANLTECCKHGNCTNHWKDEIFNALKNFPVGYIPTDFVHGLIEKLNNDDIMKVARANDNRVALIQIHSMKFNDSINRQDLLKIVKRLCYSADAQLNVFLRCLGFDNPESVEFIEAWKAKYIFMMYWIDTFLKDEMQLMCDIRCAYTVCLPHLKIATRTDLMAWVREDFLSMTGLFFDYSKFEKCVGNWQKSEAKNFRFKETDIVEQHRWDSNKHFMGKKLAGAKKVVSNEKIAQKTREDKIMREKQRKTYGEVLAILMNHVMLYLPSVSDEKFEPLENLKTLIEEKLSHVLDEQDCECLKNIFNPNEELFNIFCQKFNRFFVFKKDENEKMQFKRNISLTQSIEDTERDKFEVYANQIEVEMLSDEKIDRQLFKQINKQARKKEKEIISIPSSSMEIPKVPKKKKKEKKVTKVVVETKIVEVCEKCDGNREEMAKKTRKIEELERQVGEMRKGMNDLENDNAAMKSQITESKSKYRAEVQKHKEDVLSRETRIQQLQQEIKENREDLRVEREALYAEVEKDSRTFSETMKKMKIEIENMKFVDNSKTKQLTEMSAELEDLKIRIEIETERNQNIEKPEIQILQLNENLEVSELSEIEEIKKLEPLENMTEIVNKFVDFCKDRDEITLATLEVQKFKLKYDFYMKIVENNQKYETIPDFPMPFSANFLSVFEKYAKSNEVFEEMDSECNLCMKTIDISEDIIICRNCATEYHSKCVSWIGVITCVVCQNNI